MPHLRYSKCINNQGVASMHNKIPTINLVVSRPNANSFIYDREEFESWAELHQWAMSCDVGLLLKQWWSDTIEKGQSFPLGYDQAFSDYCFDYMEAALVDRGYKLQRIVKG